MGSEMKFAVSGLDDIRRLPDRVEVLRGSGLRDREVAVIASVRSLRELDLSGCEEVTDASVTELARSSRIESLDLSFCNQITDASLRALAGLPSLRSLNLNWCYSVTDCGLGALAQCRTLERLSLWGCEEITDAGIEAIATLPALRSLDLPEFAAITDRSLSALTRNASALESLRLDHLDEISGRGLVGLGRLRRLRTLILHACRGVRADDVAALQRTLPECRVDFAPASLHALPANSTSASPEE